MARGRRGPGARRQAQAEVSDTGTQTGAGNTLQAANTPLQATFNPQPAGMSDLLGLGQGQGQSQPLMSTRPADPIQAGTPQAAPQSVAPNNLNAQIVEIWTRAGNLNRQAAQALIGRARPEDITRAQQSRATTQPADQTTVPTANLDAAANNRSRPLDWNRAPSAGITPEVPTGSTAQATGQQTLADTMVAHRNAGLTQTFGAGIDALTVTTAANLAEILGRAEVAAAVRARLFQITQYAAIDTLNVDASSRYAPGGGKTYCNIYAFDLVLSLGAWLPRTWWTPDAITRIQGGARVVSEGEYARMRNAGEDVSNVVAPQYGTTVTEMNTNMMTGWMPQWGVQYGWRQAADMNEAQTQANSGKVVIILAANQNAGRSGHITVVPAERTDLTDRSAVRDGEQNVERPLQSQAGSNNYSYGNGRDQWWQNASHRDGHAWIYEGRQRNSIIPPEEMGR
jgi:hypothetical protein